jgi:hypothetical protein
MGEQRGHHDVARCVVFTGRAIPSSSPTAPAKPAVWCQAKFAEPHRNGLLSLGCFGGDWHRS